MEILILSVLAVYGLTTIIVESAGPFGIFWKLKKVSWLGALECFLCLSLYTSAFIALLVANNWVEWIIYTAGFSGAAIFLNKINEE